MFCCRIDGDGVAGVTGIGDEIFIFLLFKRLWLDDNIALSFWLSTPFRQFGFQLGIF